jgi:hypothetical protein
MAEEKTIEEKLRDYAELKRREKEIAEGIEKLKPEILAYLNEKHVDKLPTTMGTFAVGSKTTWKYSEAVDKLQEKEKAEGVAKQVITNFVKFSPPKPEGTEDV